MIEVAVKKRRGRPPKNKGITPMVEETNKIEETSDKDDKPSKSPWLKDYQWQKGNSAGGNTAGGYRNVTSLVEQENIRKANRAAGKTRVPAKDTKKVTGYQSEAEVRSRFFNPDGTMNSVRKNPWDGTELDSDVRAVLTEDDEELSQATKRYKKYLKDRNIRFGEETIEQGIAASLHTYGMHNVLNRLTRDQPLAVVKLAVTLRKQVAESSQTSGSSLLESIVKDQNKPK